MRAASALQPYVVRVVFADGEVRDVDIEPLLSGPVFGPLREHSLFAQVRVDELGDTITWPTGADLDPDAIYGTAPTDWSPPMRVRSPQQPLHTALLSAIRGRNVVEFRYSGQRRVVHPHAILVTPSGVHGLDALQVGGETTSGTLPGWRRFDLDDIGPVTIHDERFEVAPEFEPRARTYAPDEVLAAVGQ